MSIILKLTRSLKYIRGWMDERGRHEEWALMPMNESPFISVDSEELENVVPILKALLATENVMEEIARSKSQLDFYGIKLVSEYMTKEQFDAINFKRLMANKEKNKSIKMIDFIKEYTKELYNSNFGSNEIKASLYKIISSLDTEYDFSKINEYAEELTNICEKSKKENSIPAIR